MHDGAIRTKNEGELEDREGKISKRWDAKRAIKMLENNKVEKRVQQARDGMPKAG